MFLRDTTKQQLRVPSQYLEWPAFIADSCQACAAEVTSLISSHTLWRQRCLSHLTEPNVWVFWTFFTTVECLSHLLYAPHRPERSKELRVKKPKCDFFFFIYSPDQRRFWLQSRRWNYSTVTWTWGSFCLYLFESSCLLSIQSLLNEKEWRDDLLFVSPLKDL